MSAKISAAPIRLKVYKMWVCNHKSVMIRALTHGAVTTRCIVYRTGDLKRQRISAQRLTLQRVSINQVLLAMPENQIWNLPLPGNFQCICAWKPQSCDHTLHSRLIAFHWCTKSYVSETLISLPSSCVLPARVISGLFRLLISTTVRGLRLAML